MSGTARTPAPGPQVFSTAPHEGRVAPTVAGASFSVPSFAGASAPAAKPQPETAAAPAAQPEAPSAAPQAPAEEPQSPSIPSFTIPTYLRSGPH